MQWLRSASSPVLRKPLKPGLRPCSGSAHCLEVVQKGKKNYLFEQPLVFIYERYFPVWGVQCINSINPTTDFINIIDVRDYNESYKDPIQAAINIPVGYLRRYYGEIDSHRIHVVAANHFEKNLSVRFLRRKGFEVIGYTLTDCECKQETKKKLLSRKENFYGIQ